MNKRKNRWKTAFILLCTINILMIGALFALFVLPKKTEPISIDYNDSGIKAGFEIEKRELEQLINYYIQKEYNNGPFSYEVLLNEEVEVIGQLEIFNEFIEMKMTFTPQALENGDLLLAQTSVSIGKLNLPVSYIMNFMAKTYRFPAWVKIYPAEKVIHVDLSELVLKNGAQVRAEDFNLKTGKIHLALIFPEFKQATP
jgi:uncharacterized protein YpmS